MARFVLVHGGFHGAWCWSRTIEASHSPFLSRPAELAELLVEAITTKPTGPLRPE